MILPLFPEYPEFYAAYQLLNVKNHHIYSDKLRISVVDLSQIELATEEDRNYGIDLWARVLKATTWEEINMLAQNNKYLQETVYAVKQLTDEEKIRQCCQAREDFELWERKKNEKHQEELNEVRQERDAAIEQSSKDREALQQSNEALAAALAKIAALEAAKK